MKLFLITLAVVISTVSCEYKLVYNEECGYEAGVTEQDMKDFSFRTSSWTRKVNCYFKCEHERLGYYANGAFTPKFVEAIKRKAAETSRLVFIAAESCLELEPLENQCDHVADILKCTVLMRMLFQQR